MWSSRKLSQAIAAVALLASADVHANFVHSYVGNDFTFVENLAPSGPVYATDMRVSGYFETIDPLPASSPLIDVSSDVISFLFTDGVNTLTGANTPNVSVAVATDAQSRIIGWSIVLFEVFASPASIGDAAGFILTANDPSMVVDQGLILVCTALGPNGGCADAIPNGGQSMIAGIWTTRSTVPEPSILLLLGLGLAGLGISTRRLK